MEIMGSYCTPQKEVERSVGGNMSSKALDHKGPILLKHINILKFSPLPPFLKNGAHSKTTFVSSL